jgi:hypothetical protein
MRPSTTGCRVRWGSQILKPETYDPTPFLLNLLQDNAPSYDKLRTKVAALQPQGDPAPLTTIPFLLLNLLQDDAPEQDKLQTNLWLSKSSTLILLTLQP